MYHIEQTIYCHSLYDKFFYGYRYADDILSFFVGTNKIIERFLNLNNAIYPSLKFAMEMDTTV